MKSYKLVGSMDMLMTCIFSYSATTDVTNCLIGLDLYTCFLRFMSHQNMIISEQHGYQLPNYKISNPNVVTKLLTGNIGQ